MHGFPLIEKAEVRVACDLVVVPGEGEEEGKEEFREYGWRERLLEAIVGYHLDVFFAEGELDPEGVPAATEDAFAEEACLS